MTYLQYIYIKLYYWIGVRLMAKRALLTPGKLKNTKNLFLYFDYEREFGGHETTISDDDINLILQLLDEYGFKITWFTVGEIFDEYPESIRGILRRGHEIGSHTYHHRPPLYTSKNALKKDFQLFKEKSQRILNVKGFHSPNGSWSFSLLRYLKEYAYRYDVISSRKNEIIKPYIIGNGQNKYIIRLHTVGDDWFLYKNNCSEDDVLNYFIEQSNMFRIGDIGGIGFHPWILFSNQNIFNGFFKFLNYIKKQENTRYETAYFYADALKP